MGIFLVSTALAIVILALVSTYRPVQLTVRIEHVHLLKQMETKTPQTVDELDKEQENLYHRAKRFVKPFSERRARQRSIAANEAEKKPTTGGSNQNDYR